MRKPIITNKLQISEGTMKTSNVSINLFIGVLSSVLFFFNAIIFNAYAAKSDFNFVVVGDWGYNSNTDATVKDMANIKTTNKL